MNLADLTTDETRALLASPRNCVLLPVGSVEPHGPHLPLATDTVISLAAAERAIPLLKEKGIAACVAPAIGYGVTDYAEGFAGAISIPSAALTAFLRATIDAFLRAGFNHVCLVNNHLEPAHDAAVRAAIDGLGTKASVACPLERKWARTLSDEFKRGNCHAGRYETSLVLAAGGRVLDLRTSLPAIDTSLSDGIRSGKKTFGEMGLERAYTGAPAEASQGEGEELLGRLATMIAETVTSSC